MRVLCTGGAGFLGAWLAKRLLASGHAVRIFDRSSDRRLVSDIVGAPSAAVEWRTGDVVQPAAVMAASEGCDAIAHLAALLTPACQADPITGTNVNLIGTINVFEAARHRKLRNVVYASSAGVFGPSDGVVPFPMTLYGVYKLACEGVGRAYAADYGGASVGFRLRQRRVGRPKHAWETRFDLDPRHVRVAAGQHVRVRRIHRAVIHRKRKLAIGRLRHFLQRL